VDLVLALLEYHLAHKFVFHALAVIGVILSLNHTARVWLPFVASFSHYSQKSLYLSRIFVSIFTIFVMPAAHPVAWRTAGCIHSRVA
jgi:hypothetical protein